MKNFPTPRKGPIVRLVLAGGLAASLAGCDSEPSHLEQVRGTGELRVVTRSVPPDAVHTPVHIERELMRGLATWLGVEARFIERPTAAAALGALASGDADIAALGEPVAERYRAHLHRGPIVRTTEEIVVYRRRTPRPRTRGDLEGRTVYVPAGLAAEETLRTVSGVEVAVAEQHDTPALLQALWHEKVALVATTRGYLRSLRPAHPEVADALVLRADAPVAWHLPGNRDDSLVRAVVHYWHELRRSGELERVLYAHVGHLQTLDYVGMRRLIRRIRKRLPALEPHFKREAGQHGFDWRLLAAVGYQESHWNPAAVSPTGVAGVMMLTRETAGELGVDRTDPGESIAGAARYLQSLRERLPANIPSDEATWFALAAYNMGFNHLEGARELTRLTGGDPSRWADVEVRLPLMEQPLWYARLESGRARGRQARRYMRNVRRCYDVLRVHRPDR